MGDFNFDNALEEQGIHEEFQDLWKVFNKDLLIAPGFTMPETKRIFY